MELLQKNSLREHTEPINLKGPVLFRVRGLPSRRDEVSVGVSS